MTARRRLSMVHGHVTGVVGGDSRPVLSHVDIKSASDFCTCTISQVPVILGYVGCVVPAVGFRRGYPVP